MAIAAVAYHPGQPHSIFLTKAESRLVKVEGLAGHPVNGARLRPRALLTATEDDDIDIPPDWLSCRPSLPAQTARVPSHT